MKTADFLGVDFLTKYRHESSDFFIQNRKKGHHIDFFGPKYTLVLTKLTLSLTKYGHEGVFYVISKNHMRLQHFYENGRFVDKMGSGRMVCFREWKFFDNIWAWHGSIDFFVKFTFLVHSIGGCLQD